MKKITLLVASIFLAGGMAYASENPVFSDGNNKKAIVLNPIDYRYAEPIVFNERGIEFYVFPTGEFDFNTRPNDSHGDYYFKTAGKRGTTITIERSRRPENYGVRIEHDSFGRVRRVGNTFINYDAFDRVTRIGTVFMRYNRIALSQIGGMRIIYNRRGEIVNYFGSIKGYNRGYYYDDCDYPKYDYDYPRGADNFETNDDFYYKKEQKSTGDALEKKESRSTQK